MGESLENRFSTTFQSERKHGFSKEKLMTDPQFERLFEVFDAFQKAFLKFKGDPAGIESLEKRYVEVAYENFTADNLLSWVAHLIEDEEDILDFCIINELTKDKLAELLMKDKFYPDFCQNLVPNKKERRNDVGSAVIVLVNELVSYHYKKEDDFINVHISSAPISGTENLLMGIKRGFERVAKDLKGGKLKKINKVVMISWLLAEPFDDKIKRLFGESTESPSFKLEEMGEDGPDIGMSKFTAVGSNGRAAKEYFENGQLPSVWKLTMDKEDFIKQFQTK